MSTANEITNRVLIPKLNQTNYEQWRFALEMVLCKEDLWDVVSEDPPAPSTSQWKKRDKGAMATIALSVEPNLYYMIKDCITAKFMWIKIKQNFERIGLMSKVFIKRKLFGTRLDQFNNMESFLNSIMEQTSKLRMCGDNFDDLDIVSTILCGLPESYDNIIMGLETREESTLTLEYVRAILLDEFSRKEEKSTQAQVFMTMERKPIYQPPNRSERRCYECRRVGHLRSNCPQLKNQRNPLDYSQGTRTNDSAERYNNPHHDSRRNLDSVNIVKLRLEDNDELDLTTQQKSSSSPPESSEYYYAYAACTQESKGQHNPITDWVIDSGATRHMISNRSHFTQYNAFEQNKEVVFANGTSTSALGTGTIIIEYGDPADKRRFELDQVIFVPEITVNLLSVPTLCKQGFRTVFDGTACDVSLQEEQIFTGELREGIFKLNVSVSIPDKAMSACIHVWHRRLGHRNLENISNMEKSGKVKNLHIDKCDHDNFCATCNKSKLKQVSFKGKTERSTKASFMLIHTDICGPVKPTSRGGGNYFITIVDDYSRYCYVRVIPQKSDATAIIIEFITHCRNKFGYFPTILRSDGGGEYENTRLNGYLRNIGVQHQICVPHTPQNNGVAERINRTLIETMKSLLFEKNLPLNLWGEAAATAGYLYNRIVHSTTKETPFTLWEGRIPDLGHLRIMGSRVFAFVPKALRSKLQENSTQGVLLGYADRQKGFKVLETRNNKVIVSSSIGFDETGTPQQLENDYDSQYSLDIPLVNETQRDSLKENNCNLRRSTRDNIGQRPVRYREEY